MGLRTVSSPGVTDSNCSGTPSSSMVEAVTGICTSASRRSARSTAFSMARVRLSEFTVGTVSVKSLPIWCDRRPQIASREEPAAAKASVLRQPEKALRGSAGAVSDFEGRFVAALRDHGQYPGEVCRFVALACRLGVHGARQQVGSVALDHEAPGRYGFHQLLQFLAAPLVADPAGDADVQVHVQIAE